jgi:anti-sigma B factor antagonist
MGLTTETRMLAGIAVVRCTGALVFGTQAAELHLYVKELLASAPHIVLNFEKVPYVDSAGMGMLIGAYISAMKAGGSIVLAGLNNKVRRAMERSKLLMIFNVYSSEAEAVASVR